MLHSVCLYSDFNLFYYARGACLAPFYNSVEPEVMADPGSSAVAATTQGRNLGWGRGGEGRGGEATPS